MKLARLLVVPVLLAATLSLTGCGSADLTLGQSAVVDLSLAGKPESVYEITVTSLVEAPAAVVAQYDTEDKIYFATVEGKLKEPAKVGDGHIGGFHTNVYSKLSDGNYLDTFGSGPDECSGSPADFTQAVNDLKAGKSVSVCVPLTSDKDKDLVGVYVGPSDVNSGEGKVWVRS